MSLFLQLAIAAQDLWKICHRIDGLITLKRATAAGLVGLLADTVRLLRATATSSTGMWSGERRKGSIKF